MPNPGSRAQRRVSPGARNPANAIATLFPPPFSTGGVSGLRTAYWSTDKRRTPPRQPTSGLVIRRYRSCEVIRSIYAYSLRVCGLANIIPDLGSSAENHSMTIWEGSGEAPSARDRAAPQPLTIRESPPPHLALDPRLGSAQWRGRHTGPMARDERHGRKHCLPCRVRAGATVRKWAQIASIMSGGAPKPKARYGFAASTDGDEPTEPLRSP